MYTIKLILIYVYFCKQAYCFAGEIIIIITYLY